MINLNPDPCFVPHTAAVLGSTGSVGTQTLDVIRELGLTVEFLTAGENTSLLAEQIREFHPKTVAVGSEAAAGRLRDQLVGEKPEIIWKPDETESLIETCGADIIFHSVAGLNGLPSAMAAARSGKRVGMANKEAIIAAGDLIFDEMKKSGGQLLPVDSEHCAVFRCLEGKSTSDIRRILLTASGGPFFGKTAEEMARMTAEDALCHPTWKMGKKITVDCATLMNKGFEIIEAVRLFGMPEERVSVVVHRQSVIHSMVEFIDGTLLAQMGRPDMRDCIRYAATAPHCAAITSEPLDLTAIGKLTFEKPDTAAFPLLDTAREAIRIGGTAPVSLIAADEEAVDAFLGGRIGFTEISSYVIETLGKAAVSYEVNADTIRAAETESRQICRQLIQGK